MVISVYESLLTLVLLMTNCRARLGSQQEQPGAKNSVTTRVSLAGRGRQQREREKGKARGSDGSMATDESVSMLQRRPSFLDEMQGLLGDMATTNSATSPPTPTHL